MIQLELAELITKYRKEAGMTIDELAQRSGVPKGTLTKIVGGVTKAPTLETVKAIADALGKRLADFDDPPKTENAPASEDAEALRVEEVMEAFYSAGLVPRGQDLTDEDLRFLLSVVAALRQWFGGEDAK
jgi:transcriptional regulator with XRE-family HTH domain